jgi:hypothetical protein
MWITKNIFVLFTCWISLLVPYIECSNPSSILYDDLMSGVAPLTIMQQSQKKSIEAYNSLIKPTGLGLNGQNFTDQNGALLVYTKMSLKQIVSFDEKNQILTTNVNFYLTWYDERLSWSPKNYSGITNIQAHASEFWLPDISIINAAGTSNLVTIASNLNVGINSIGFVSLSLSLPSLQTRCALNVKKYPFDTQKCSIVVGSWMYTTLSINLAFYDNFISKSKSNQYFDTSSYIEHPYWDMASVSCEFVIDSSRFLQVNELAMVFTNQNQVLKAQDMSFDLVLVRKPLYVMINSIYINFVLNIVILLAFFMPFTAQMSVCKYFFLLT